MHEPLSLDELLRRCHRDELLPLAERLKIRAGVLGIGDLARIISRTLRRRGDHALRNLVLRGGEGPDYPTLLRQLAARLELPSPSGPVIEIEQALLQQWADRAWAQMDDTQRATLAASLDVDTLPDSPPDVTTLTVRGRVGELVPWKSGAVVLGGAAVRLGLVLLGPFAGIAALVWLGRPRDETLLASVLEVARLRQLVEHRITVGVVGSPSSGKDAAIKAIFGVDSGNIDPVAGSTRAVTITRLPSATALFVVNTPGMGDIVEEVTEHARQILAHIDVYLYVINAQGGVQARELEDYRRCLASGRPVLAVINKIDTLRPADRERYLADAQVKLGAPAEDFCAVAFDPLPQLSPTPINIEAVQSWLSTRLSALGKLPGELPWERP
ncbi:MAG: GTP-binding protein EngB required for normal cell division [Myxococcota bacterium]|jgi:GTP-binding protein EngB required for normal cell division